MDTRKKEVIVLILYWWLHMVYTVQNCFLTFCVVLTLHSQRTLSKPCTTDHHAKRIHPREMIYSSDVEAAEDVVEEVEDMNLEGGLENVGDHQLQSDYDTTADDAAFSDSPSTSGSDRASVSKKRHKCHIEKDVTAAEVLRKVCGNMGRSIQEATEKLCTEIRRLAHEAAMDEKVERLFEDLLKVSDLTTTELFEAHRKILEDDTMLVVFPTVPDHLKADWIRSLIK